MVLPNILCWFHQNVCSCDQQCDNMDHVGSIVDESGLDCLLCRCQNNIPVQTNGCGAVHENSRKDGIF